MSPNNLLKEIEELQESVKHMAEDDIEENPEMAFEEFQCGCCAQIKILAGSLIYEDVRLCNDCVVLAEASFLTKKISHISELIDSTEDKRFEIIYKQMFNEDKTEENA